MHARRVFQSGLSQTIEEDGDEVEGSSHYSVYDVLVAKTLTWFTKGATTYNLSAVHAYHVDPVDRGAWQDNHSLTLRYRYTRYYTPADPVMLIWITGVNQARTGVITFGNEIVCSQVATTSEGRFYPSMFSTETAKTLRWNHPDDHAPRLGWLRCVAEIN